MEPECRRVAGLLGPVEIRSQSFRARFVARARGGRTMRMRISFLEKRRWKSLANVIPIVRRRRASVARRAKRVVPLGARIRVVCARGSIGHVGIFSLDVLFHLYIDFRRGLYVLCIIVTRARTRSRGGRPSSRFVFRIIDCLKLQGYS